MAPNPSLPEYYRPEQTAVLLMDKHKFLFQTYDNEAFRKALQQAVKLKKWANLHNVEVIHCLVSTEQEPAKTRKGAERISGMIANVKHNGLADEHDDLADPTEKTFTRRAGLYSAMGSSGLEAYLRGKGIVSLLLAGLSTSGCVMRTSIAAADLEFVVTVVEDACADPKPELHNSIMQDVLMGISYVETVEQLESKFAKLWWG